jgi:hypothetical protein
MNTDTYIDSISPKFVKVAYKSDVLGQGVFWEGRSGDIDQISNIPAKIAAKSAVATNKICVYGMWTATPTNSLK